MDIIFHTKYKPRALSFIKHPKLSNTVNVLKYSSYFTHNLRFNSTSMIHNIQTQYLYKRSPIPLRTGNCDKN